MAILASLPRVNLFSSLPPTPPRNDQSSPSTSFSPPIPVPKYRPPSNRRRNPQNAPPENPALKLPHRRTKYYKRVKEGDVLSVDGDQSRGVVIGESGVSYLLPGAPFEFQFSYSEVPAAKPVAVREPAYLPFAPPTMPRPWTGKPPVKKKPGKKIPLFDSFSPPPPGKKGVKYVQMPGPFPMGKFPVEGRSREEVLGEPLAKWEVKELIKPMLRDNRQVNLGRDGLTHNMLDLVHTHWKRRRVCKVRCLGVPTVDIANVCRALEEKTGGKVIYRAGGVIYLFRGRNYNYRTRPQYPMMLWKPAAPVYPKLIQEAPEGLTKAEADELREKGKKLLPIRKIAKNGVYLTLVRDVRSAFEGCPLVKLNCKGLHASDYKKLGAKLKELVPCVLLSFDDEQILMWRGQNWKSRYPIPPLPLDIVNPYHDTVESKGDCSEPDLNQVVSSPKMMSLWKHAIDSNKARLLEELDLAPDALHKKVEEFESISQAADHSYQALVVSTEDIADSGMATTETDSSSVNFDEDDYYSDDEGQTYEYDEGGQTYEYDEDDSPEDADPTVPLGSLPIDRLTEKLRFKRIGRED